MKKFLTFILFIVFFSLAGCAKIDIGKPNDLDPKQNNDELPVSIVLESINKQHKLFIGDELQLKATVYPATITEAVVFSSNNDKVATITQTGLVSGVSEGTVKITAKVTKSTTTIEGFLVLTVEKKPVELISVAISGEDSVYIDDNLKLNLELNPLDATPLGQWSTDNEEIAIVDQNGIVYGKNIGTVKIIYFVNEQIKADKTITVIDRIGPAAGIELVFRNKIEVEEVVQAYIDVVPLGSIKGEITYTSSDSSIATIDSSGKIRGISAGIVLITATNADDLTSTVELEVLNYNLDSPSLEDNLVELARTRKDAVFGVSNYQYDADDDLIRNSLGSGFVYKVDFILKDGGIVYNIEELRTFADVEYFKYYLITNRHVVEGSDVLKIYLPQIDNEIPANLIQYDDKVDLAIVTFNYDEYIRPLDLGDSSELVSGRFAVAIGNPNGYEFSSTATFGIISHPLRYLATDTNEDGINDWDSEYIQHDVAINPGNSGGPLFNLKGEVIGINTLKYVSSNIEGMGFSIPINVVKDLIPILESGEKPKRALLGVTAVAVKDVLNNPKSEYTIPEGIDYGLLVIDIVPGSVAALGGIQVGDIITSFNDVEISNVIILRAQLNKIVIGQTTKITVLVYRDGAYVSLELIF